MVITSWRLTEKFPSNVTAAMRQTVMINVVMAVVMQTSVSSELTFNAG